MGREREVARVRRVLRVSARYFIVTFVAFGLLIQDRGNIPKSEVLT